MKNRKTNIIVALLENIWYLIYGANDAAMQIVDPGQWYGKRFVSPFALEANQNRAPNNQLGYRK